MKKVKQSLALFLIICLLASVIPAAALAENSEGQERPGALIEVQDYNELYISLLLEQEGTEPLVLNANTNYPVPEGCFTLTAEITEEGLRNRYPFYSNALLVITPTGFEEFSYAAPGGNADDVIGSISFSAEDEEIAAGFKIEVMEHNRPLVNEYMLHYAQDNGGQVFVNDDYYPNDTFGNFEVDNSVTLSLPEGMRAYKITAETGSFGNDQEIEIIPDNDGSYTYIFPSSAGTTFQIYWSEEEYKFSHPMSFLQEGYSLYDLLLDGAGRQGTVTAVGLSENTDYYIIGSRFNRTAVAVSDSVSNITLRVTPAADYSFREAFVGNLTITELDADDCFSFPADSSHRYITVYFSYTEPSHSWVNGYDDNCFTLTVNGEPYRDREFIPEAGQVIRAERTEQGMDEDRYLKGLCIWMHDGSARYVYTNENGIAEYTVTSEDAACGFDVELIDWDRPFPGEYVVYFNDGNGAQVSVQGEDETILQTGETYSIPDNAVPYTDFNDITFYSLKLKSDSLYAVQISADNINYTLMPEDLIQYINEDGTWSIPFCGIDIDEETHTFTNLTNKAYFINIWWDQASYEFDNLHANYEDGEYILYFTQLNLINDSLIPELRYTNLLPVCEMLWYGDSAKQVVKKMDDNLPGSLLIYYPAASPDLTVSVFVNGNLETDYGKAADESGWIPVPADCDTDITLLAFRGDAAVFTDVTENAGFECVISSEFIAPIIPNGTYYAMLFYGVNKENFDDTVSASQDDVNDFTEACFCALGSSDECYYICDFYCGGMVPETEYYAKVVLFFAGEEENTIVGFSEPFVFTTDPCELDIITPGSPIMQNEIGYNCYSFTPNDTGWYEITATNAAFLAAKDRMNYLESHHTASVNPETEMDDLSVLFFAEKDTACYLYVQQFDSQTASNILLTARPINTKQDTATGVTAEADGELSLVVNEIKDSPDIPDTPESHQDAVIYDATEDLLDGEIADFILFNVTLVDSNSEETQPAGSILISIPVPDEYDVENCMVYHIASDGTADEIKADITEKNGIIYLTFVTNHLSYYALVYQPEYDVGDINGDGIIDLIDVSLLFRWWNGQIMKLAERRSDINGDACIDLRDAAALYRSYTSNN